MMTEEAQRVNIKRYPSLQEASEGAGLERDLTNGFLIPATLFRQGGRQHLSAVMSIRQIRQQLEVRPAPKKGSIDEVLREQNRPLDKDHVRSIKDYIAENLNQAYILPPMTLNVRDAVNFYAPDFKGEILQGFAVLPGTAKISITDGGHRKQALDEISAELGTDSWQELSSHSIPVMITIEPALPQVHQDFADCSKTKALPKSLIAAYDRRNPANGMVVELIENCPLFKGKIDSASKTLSAKSVKLFLTNQVRQMVKELLLSGGYGLADDAFEKQATHLLGSSSTDAYKTRLARFTEYINLVTQSIPVLKKVSELRDYSQIPLIRGEGYVCLAATGLVVIGRIGNELLQDAHDDDWTERVACLGSIDWRRHATIWQGNIIQNNKLITQQGPVKGAVEIVRRTIGLDKRLSKAEQMEEELRLIDMPAVR